MAKPPFPFFRFWMFDVFDDLHPTLDRLGMTAEFGTVGGATR
jgi:hypothetical protein